MAAYTIPSIFTAIDKFTAPVRKMTASVQTFAQKAEIGVARADRAFRQMTSPLGKLNRMLGGFGLLIGGTLILGGITNAVGVFKDFEQANKTLASVMISATQPQLKALQIDAKRLGATTAKSATEVVGLQEAFARLGFTAPDIINMTESVINGSIAMNSELAATAELAGAMVNSFDAFSSIDTPKIMDQMVAATQQSALSFEKLQAGLPIVSGAANAAGIPFTKLLALMGKLSDAGIDASSSSTALRNIFLDSASKGLKYEQILGQIVKNQDKLTAANDKFGKRGAVSAVILAQQIAKTNELDKALQNAGGTAKTSADIQLQSLNGAITILKSSYEGFILSLEDGNGAFSKMLTKIVQVTSEVLSLASGSAIAKSELSDQALMIRNLAETTTTWLKVIGYVIAAMVAFKVLIISAKIALAAYNIVLGITGALSSTASIAIGANAIALKAYIITAKAVTAAQWLWNAAMTASPLGLTYGAILLIIGVISILVTYWDSWGASVMAVGAVIAAFFSPVIAGIGLIVSLIMSVYNNWNMLTDAFSNGGFLDGLLAIGKVLFDVILYPIQQILGLLSNIPGLDFAASLQDDLNKFRGSLGLNVEDEQTPTINPEASRQNALSETIKREQTNATLTIDNKTGFGASVENDNNFIPVNLTPSYGF